MGARSRLAVSNGAVWFGWNPRRAESDPIWKGWSCSGLPAEDRWRFKVWLPERGFNAIGGWRHVQVPLWMIAAPFAVGTIGIGVTNRRRRRRLASGACIQCGYDREGLPIGAPCPECGSG